MSTRTAAIAAAAISAIAIGAPAGAANAAPSTTSRCQATVTNYLKISQERARIARMNLSRAVASHNPAAAKAAQQRLTEAQHEIAWLVDQGRNCPRDSAVDAPTANPVYQAPAPQPRGNAEAVVLGRRDVAPPPTSFRGSAQTVVLGRRGVPPPLIFANVIRTAPSKVTQPQWVTQESASTTMTVKLTPRTYTQADIPALRQVVKAAELDYAVAFAAGNQQAAKAAHQRAELARAALKRLGA